MKLRLSTYIMKSKFLFIFIWSMNVILGTCSSNNQQASLLPFDFIHKFQSYIMKDHAKPIPAKPIVNNDYKPKHPTSFVIGSNSSTEYSRLVMQVLPSQGWVWSNFKDGHLTLSYLDHRIITFGILNNTNDINLNSQKYTQNKNKPISLLQTSLAPRTSLEDELKLAMEAEHNLENEEVMDLKTENEVEENEALSQITSLNTQSEEKLLGLDGPNTELPTNIKQLKPPSIDNMDNKNKKQLIGMKNFVDIDGLELFSKRGELNIQNGPWIIQSIPQWIMVHFDGFDNNIVGWSQTKTQRCGESLNVFLGGYCNFAELTAAKTFALPPHNQIKIQANYHFFDKWEHDIGYMKIDGQTVWTKEYNHCNSIFQQNCHGLSICGDNSYADEMGTLIEVVLNHTNLNVTLEFGSTLLDKETNSGCSASWAIDNVRIDVIQYHL